MFNFHRFDNLRHSERKYDPRRSQYEKKGMTVVALLFAAKAGDFTALQRYMQVSLLRVFLLIDSVFDVIG